MSGLRERPQGVIDFPAAAPETSPGARSVAGPKAGRQKPPDDHRKGHRDRLRARFRRAGADALQDYELLELLLFRAIPRRDVKELAKDLIAR